MAGTQEKKRERERVGLGDTVFVRGGACAGMRDRRRESMRGFIQRISSCVTCHAGTTKITLKNTCTSYLFGLDTVQRSLVRSFLPWEHQYCNSKMFAECSYLFFVHREAGKARCSLLKHLYSRKCKAVTFYDTRAAEAAMFPSMVALTRVCCRAI